MGPFCVETMQKFGSRLKTAQWVGAVQVLQTREGVTQTLQVQSKVCKKNCKKTRWKVQQWWVKLFFSITLSEFFFSTYILKASVLTVPELIIKVYLTALGRGVWARFCNLFCSYYSTHFTVFHSRFEKRIILNTHEIFFWLYSPFA